MSLHEPTIADLQQALEVVQEREREVRLALQASERTIELQAKQIRERNVLLEEANGIIVRQSRELTMMCEANNRLETELNTLRAGR